jgi:diguanylate cyclase (GGDEF)-like protein/PAS domain S-box-containing protein
MSPQTESLFSKVFHSNVVSVCIMTLAEGRMIAFNTSYSQLLGYSNGVLASSSAQSLPIWCDPSERSRALQLLLANGRCDGWEAQWQRADGQILDVVLTMEVLDIEAGSCMLTFVRDVTGQRRMERELRESEERFRQSFESAIIGKALVGLDGCWMEVNPALCALLGYSEKELLAISFQDLTHPEDLKVDVDYVQQMLKGRISAYRMEKRYLHRQGTDVWVQLCVSAVHDAHGLPLYFVSEIQDISERKQYENQLAQQQQNLEEANRQLAQINRQLEETNERLAYLATTDGLTGLSNRRTFDEHLNLEVARAARRQAPLSLLMLDVDHFKLYNDAFGHPAGDEVLRLVAQLISAQARSTDVVARYGGEEFAVLLPGTSGQGALALAERFRCTLETISWPQRDITASGGVSTLLAGRTMDTKVGAEILVREADRALYQAKSNGRNCVVYAN